jgi:AraC-like DNA-binding protein
VILDYRKLEAKIYEVYGRDRAKFAEDLGMSETTLSQRLNFNTDISMRSYFSQPEISKIFELLHIPMSANNIKAYFFTEKV